MRTFSPKSRKPKRKDQLRPVLLDLEGEENIHPPNGKNSPRDSTDPNMKPVSPRDSSKKKSPRFASLPSPRAGPLLKKRDKGPKETDTPTKHEEPTSKKHDGHEKDKPKKNKKEKNEDTYYSCRLTHDHEKRDDREDRDSKREREDRDSKREDNRGSKREKEDLTLPFEETVKPTKIDDHPPPRRRERSSFPRKENSPRGDTPREQANSPGRGDKLGRANTAPSSLKRDKKKAPASPQSPRRPNKLKDPELEIPLVTEIRITSASPRGGSPPISPRGVQVSPRSPKQSPQYSPLHSPRTRVSVPPYITSQPSTSPHVSPRPKTMTSGQILSALTPPLSPRTQVSDHAASGTSEEEHVNFKVLRDPGHESHAGSGTSSDDEPPKVQDKHSSLEKHDKRRSNHRTSKEHERHETRRPSISQPPPRRVSVDKTPVYSPRRSSVDKTPIHPLPLFDLPRRSSIGQDKRSSLDKREDKRSSLDKRGQSTEKADKIKIHYEVSEDHLESTTEDAELIIVDDDALSNSEGAKVYPKKPLLQLPPKSVLDQIPINTMTKSCSSTSDKSKALNTTHDVALPQETNLSSNSASETEQTEPIQHKIKPRLPLHHIPTMTKSSSSDLRTISTGESPKESQSTAILYSPGRQPKHYLLSKSASSSRAPETTKRVMKRNTRATSRSSSDEFSCEDDKPTKFAKLTSLYQPHNLRIQDPDFQLVSMDYQTLEETEAT